MQWNFLTLAQPATNVPGAVDVDILLLLSYGICPVHMEMYTNMRRNGFAVKSEAYRVLVVIVKSYEGLLTLSSMHRWLMSIDKVSSCDRARDTSSNCCHRFY